MRRPAARSGCAQARRAGHAGRDAAARARAPRLVGAAGRRGSASRRLDRSRRIEANRFDALGAPVYAKGHLRKYATLLGLSPETVIARYEALERHVPAEPTPIPVVMRRRVPSVSRSSVAAADRRCRCWIAAGWIVRSLTARWLRRRDRACRGADGSAQRRRSSEVAAPDSSRSRDGEQSRVEPDGRSAGARRAAHRRPPSPRTAATGRRSPSASGVQRAVVGRDLRRRRASG